MNRTMKYVGMLSLLLLCVTVTPLTSAAIQQQSMPPMYQCPYMGYGYQYPGYPSGGYGSSGYGMMPYSMDYCMHWQQPQWVPVQVMIPGRWEYRLVWIPGYATTLYRWVPGYWQRTSIGGQPDVTVWPNTNGGWYATPYQSQAGSGFNPYGLWQGTFPTQSQSQTAK